MLKRKERGERGRREEERILFSAMMGVSAIIRLKGRGPAIDDNTCR